MPDGRRNAGRAAAWTMVVMLAVSGCVTVPTAPPPILDGGPLLSHDTDLAGDDRLRAAGPLVERLAVPDGPVYSAVHPLVSTVVDPVRDRQLTEYLWPLGMKKDLAGETDWRYLVAFGHDFDNQAPSRFRYTLFPLLFGGRDAAGDHYVALFPLGGSIHEFLGRDRISFVLFPLYSTSEAGNLSTWNVLWPLISRTTGRRTTAFRILPFYGYREQKDDWRKTFVMWPFWTSAVHQNPDYGPGRGFILFPLFGHGAFAGETTWMWLPPLFRWTHGPKRTILNAPYPIIQRHRGEVNRNYVWPLYGHRWSEGEDYRFVLWPIMDRRTTDRSTHVVRRSRVFPVFYTESKARTGVGNGAEDEPWPRGTAASDAAGGAPAGLGYERYVKVWPLFSYAHGPEETRFRALELWPLVRTWGVERNWSRLWTLYTASRLGDARESEWLWGLYRNRVTPEEGRRWSVFPLFSYAARAGDDGGAREWSFLLGMGQRKRHPAGTHWRLFWILNFGAADEGQL